MAQVLVWNDNDHDYQEKFRDHVVKIPAKKSIPMDYDEANHFLARCNGIKRNADGQPDPAGFKKLRIEPLGTVVAAEPEVPKFVSHKDGKTFDTQAELDEHMKQFEGQELRDDAAEKALSAIRGQKSSGAQKRA